MPALFTTKKHPRIGASRSGRTSCATSSSARLQVRPRTAFHGAIPPRALSAAKSSEVSSGQQRCSHAVADIPRERGFHPDRAWQSGAGAVPQDGRETIQPGVSSRSMTRRGPTSCDSMTTLRNTFQSRARCCIGGSGHAELDCGPSRRIVRSRNSPIILFRPWRGRRPAQPATALRLSDRRSTSSRWR